MKLRAIDKDRYSKHYKIVFVAVAIELAVVSILCSTLLISWLSTPDENHFLLNVAGVVIAALLACYALYRLHTHPFMDEVVYVWNLKKQLNRIYRMHRKIEPLIEDDHVDAMVVMNYFYLGSKQLYELDDNTITLEDLALKSARLDTKLKEQNLRLSSEDYSPEILEQF